MQFSELSPETWPAHTLSMAALLTLNPPQLRRVLKAGLRQGAADADLRQLIATEFGWAAEADEVDQLLALLQEHSWMRRNGDTWKTHLV